MALLREEETDGRLRTGGWRRSEGARDREKLGDAETRDPRNGKENEGGGTVRELQSVLLFECVRADDDCENKW